MKFRTGHRGGRHGGGGTRWPGWDRLRKRGWLPLSSTLRRGETRYVLPLFLPFHALVAFLFLSLPLSLFLLSSASLILEFRHSAPLIMQALFSNPPDERRNLKRARLVLSRANGKNLPLFFPVYSTLCRTCNFFFHFFYPLFAIEIFAADMRIKDRKRELEFRFDEKFSTVPTYIYCVHGRVILLAE